MRINNVQPRRHAAAAAAAAAMLTDRRTDSGGLFAGRNYSNISSASDCTNKGRLTSLHFLIIILIIVVM